MAARSTYWYETRYCQTAVCTTPTSIPTLCHPPNFDPRPSTLGSRRQIPAGEGNPSLRGCHKMANRVKTRLRLEAPSPSDREPQVGKSHPGIKIRLNASCYLFLWSLEVPMLWMGVDTRGGGLEVSWLLVASILIAIEIVYAYAVVIHLLQCSR
jgi:hypothetical protein